MEVQKPEQKAIQSYRDLFLRQRRMKLEKGWSPIE